MRIVIISFYYPPDLSAGSFRTGALVESLLEMLGPQDSVRVLTTAPNRYASLLERASALETLDRLTIERIPLLQHKSGLKDQLRAFMGFACEVMLRVRSERADVVYATSSRLGTASLGALVARRCRARLHLDIRDLFVENMSNMLKGPARVTLLPLKLIERITFRAADQISIVSPGFSEALGRANTRVTPLLRTNGIDEEFLGQDYSQGSNKPPLILYAGNIGDGQGLSRLVPEVAARLHGRYQFCIIGDGGRRVELEARIKEVEARVGHGLAIQILPPMKRTDLIAQYARADILLVHLNDYPAFRLVIPSKIFEYGATGKPIIAGLSGVSALFVREHLKNSTLFRPCDVDGFVEAIGRLALAPTDRSLFIAEYGRTAIVRNLAKDLLALARMQAGAA